MLILKVKTKSGELLYLIVSDSHVASSQSLEHSIIVLLELYFYLVIRFSDNVCVCLDSRTAWRRGWSTLGLTLVL
ncbi:hypothetical protein RRG08_066937 [Elysia crispata]|uniref:Uncharacterized protein n=1 Tax=Elysia crispata TaxID=231223 RepID=A0AAE1AQ50_9GAST|nr:hypothetical protein RRG08_066937 [Elysia crispata]